MGVLRQHFAHHRLHMIGCTIGAGSRYASFPRRLVALSAMARSVCTASW
jgi:hypothetical protein